MVTKNSIVNINNYLGLDEALKKWSMYCFLRQKKWFFLDSNDLLKIHSDAYSLNLFKNLKFSKKQQQIL